MSWDILCRVRDPFVYARSQWETTLHCTLISHWLGAYTKWYLQGVIIGCIYHDNCSQISNTLRPKQNGCHFPDNIFKCIFLNESIWISIEISLKFVPKGPINNIPALVQIMAWCRTGDKPLSETMLVCLLIHICLTRPHWGLVIHVSINDLCHHWFRSWFVTCSASDLPEAMLNYFQVEWYQLAVPNYPSSCHYVLELLRYIAKLVNDKLTETQLPFPSNHAWLIMI